MVKIGYKVLLAADVWTYTPRSLTKFTGTPRSDLVGADEVIYTRLDEKISPIKGFDHTIPVTPVSGSYGEKFKQMIIRYAVIGPTVGSVSVGAGASADLDVQPPAGETWEISLGGQCTGYAGNRGRIGYYDGVTHYVGMTHWDENIGGVSMYFALIDNSVYARLNVINRGTATFDFTYGYSGYKVKSSSIRRAKLTPTRELIEKMSEVRRLKNGGSAVLPDWCKPLEPYAYIDQDGDIAIYLEKDVPLRVDDKGNVIERLTISVKLKSFETLFAEEIADSTKRPLMTYIREKSVRDNMGWEKYVDKWRDEGIEF